ncbi:nucleotidyltransferase domain-containing protein [Tenacibaculum amylolyticum]|uniref:nucleotidyltransferase domain-containing protein n=1 Tax=Tenacibaculum amylolyticum TaxID=104269 RepID=UPI0038B45CC6
MKTQHLSSIKSFVKETFPDATGALLTGSFAKKKNTENSDIDIIIFSDSVSQTFVEKIKHQQFKYDIIYLSTHYNYLLRNLYLDINSRYGVYFNMISSAVILFDKTNFLSELIHFSKKKLILEYGTLTSNQLNFKKKTIVNALEDIEDIKTFGEYYFASYLIVDELTDILLSHKLSTIGRGKNKARELAKAYPSFYNKIMREIENWNKIEFKKLVLDKLLFFGEIQDSNSLKSIPTFNNEKNYEVVLKRKYIPESFFRKDLHKISQKLKAENFALQYYSYNNDNFTITVQSSNTKEKYPILLKSWLINYYKIASSDRVNIQLKQTKLLPFCNTALNNALEKDLILITDLILENKNILANKIAIFSFGKLFIKKTLESMSIKNSKEFYQYIYLSNIANSYDIDYTYYNYKQLIKKRKEKIKEIKMLNESLVSYNEVSHTYNIFCKNSSFIKTYKNAQKEMHFHLLKSQTKEECLEDKIILNFYFNFILDTLNPNILSLIAYNLYNE